MVKIADETPVAGKMFDCLRKRLLSWGLFAVERQVAVQAHSKMVVEKLISVRTETIAVSEQHPTILRPQTQCQESFTHRKGFVFLIVYQRVGIVIAHHEVNKLLVQCWTEPELIHDAKTPADMKADIFVFH